MSEIDRDDVGARGEAKFRPLEVDAADGAERQRRDAPLPFGQPVEPLRRDGQVLGDRREDRPERDIVGLDRKTADKLGLGIGRDAEL